MGSDKQDEGWTKKDQPQEPGPSRDATVRKRLARIESEMRVGLGVVQADIKWLIARVRESRLEDRK
jgi:hypothetical protein